MTSTVSESMRVRSSRSVTVNGELAGTVLAPNATVTNHAPIDRTLVAASHYSRNDNCIIMGRPCRHRSGTG